MQHEVDDSCKFIVNSQKLIYCQTHKLGVTTGMTKDQKVAMWDRNAKQHSIHGLIPVPFNHCLYTAQRCSIHNVLCLDEEQ